MIRQLHILPALCLVLLAGCGKESDPAGQPEPGAKTSLTFTYRGAIASRAVAALDREKAIHDLSLFAYAADGTFVAELTEGNHYTQTAAGGNTTINVSHDFLAAHAGEQMQFYFIANNAASKGGSHTAGIDPATLTAAEFENLPTAPLPASTVEVGRQQGIFLMYDSEGLLMSGKSGMVTITGKQTHAVSLTRRTARFDLYNPAPEDYSLQTFYISSAADRGALFGTGKGTQAPNAISVASFEGPWYSTNPGFNDYDATNTARGYFYLYPGTFGQGQMELGVLVKRKSDDCKAMCYLDLSADTPIRANTRYTINFNPATLTFSMTENGNDWDDGGEVTTGRLFSTGFEGTTTLTAANTFTGVDNTVPAPNDWTTSFGNGTLGAFKIQYEGGTEEQRWARIVPEPGNTSNQILHFWASEANVNGTKTRVQANIYEGKGLKELYQKVRMYLPDDMNAMKTYNDAINWCTIMEMWNNPNWGGAENSFRISVGIGKPTAGRRELYFIVDAEDHKDGAFTKIWEDHGQSFAVPVGQWMTIEYYFLEGDASTGRFYMAVTPEGGEKVVICDIRNYTHATGDTSPDGLTHWNPMKLYTSKALTDHVRSQGKALQIYWDDFEIWENRRP